MRDGHDFDIPQALIVVALLATFVMLVLTGHGEYVWVLLLVIFFLFA